MSKLHSTNYVDTFIEVAEDCPVSAAERPLPKGDVHTVASLQYELLAGHAHELTSDDVLFRTHATRNDIAETDAARAAFFSKGQPCMRASPLTKRYGYGVHSDSKGRIALVPVESAQYKKLAADPKLKHLKAMRSARAG
jgi:hypothetical protein